VFENRMLRRIFEPKRDEVTDPYGRILGFLDRSRYFSIK
jgi:hypothetical protein